MLFIAALESDCEMKKILILSRRMDIGGVEISLLNLLKSFDYSKFDVTLLLQEKKGVLLEKIPREVSIKEMHFKRKEYLKLVQLDVHLALFKELKFKILAAKCKHASGDNPFFYKALDYCTADLEEYDVAIDYHGYGYFTTIFMVNKVKAKKYATFIHDDKIDWMENLRSIRQKIDYYFCVSKACESRIKEKYPDLSNKTKLFYNIVDINKIKHLSEEPQTDIANDTENVLVTVGRLEWQKGYDFLLEVAELLKKHIDYCWYIIGNGSWMERLRKNIKVKGLTHHVFLLGAKENPYPYIKRADVYVQTSRHEGYGLAVCEARILCKPIVSTDLPCIREQIINGVNGYLGEFVDTEFAKLLYKLLSFTNLLKHLANPL